MSKKTKHTKQNREARPRRFRWWRVIMWTFLGYMYAVTGLGMSTTIDGIWFLGAELIASSSGSPAFSSNSTSCAGRKSPRKNACANTKW
ncbi:hypothetical protein [Lacticaseibacillus sharpeae]|uniref:hypothetical protein n=1 Tax=Lacticaseibacillus sharpeae TaxID=1626 RepID=UPI0012E14D51|nr:hypothetical protein [Lacticaseibacillus sharpeae]